MKIINEIIGLRKACQKNFDKLNKKELITVFEVNVSSCEIWGGLGDRDEDDHYCINKEGWLKIHVITETGQYQKSDSGVISHIAQGITDEAILNILNGDCDIRAIREFINFYDKIYKEYYSDFR